MRVIAYVSQYRSAESEDEMKKKRKSFEKILELTL